MTVEDTMLIGDGNAQCDVPTTLARNIYDGSVAKDVPPPSSGLCLVEPSLIYKDKLMWDCMSILFEYSLKTKNKNQSVWCYQVHWETMWRVVHCSQYCTYIHVCSSDLCFFDRFSQTAPYKVVSI